MSARTPVPRPPRGSQARRPHVVAIAVAWLMTRATNLLGQSPAPQGELPTSDAVRGEVPIAVPIPLTSLGDMTSLEASASLSAKGTLKGKEMSGDLLVQFVGDEREQYRIDITGDLLGPIVAHFGGKLGRFFRPRQVSAYVVEAGSYLVVSGITELCIKPEDNTATNALGQLSPRTLMAILTDSDVANGSLVGTETLNGAPVDHYVIDGPTFLAAAKASSHPAVQTFGGALRSARDGDLYIDNDTGYPVRYQGAFSGSYEPIGLDGDFYVQVDLTQIGTDSIVSLPAACAKPISR